MLISKSLLREIESDLGLNAPFIKGQNTDVHNCWHFSTDGKAIDYLFKDDSDFLAGMNRIYFVSKRFNVTILAFALMDTHIHFILYGEYGQCHGFIHEYIRRTSIYLSNIHGEKHKLGDIHVSCQIITDDLYLKTAICYVVKNPPVGGMHYNAYDYVWSSGSLYFRRKGKWTSPIWMSGGFFHPLGDATQKYLKKTFHTNELLPAETLVHEGMIFPGEYVAYELVEKLFYSYKNYNYFMCVSRENDIESRGGAISRMTLPIQELRQHRDELCRTFFNVDNTHYLDMAQRLRLAKSLKAKYNSSVKQICKVCGLVYDEAKPFL